MAQAGAKPRLSCIAWARPRHPGEGPEKFNPDIRYRGSLQNYHIEFPFYDDPKQQIESDYGLGSPSICTSSRNSATRISSSR